MKIRESQENVMSVTRKSQKTDTIYVTPGLAKGEEESVFFTPDGEGRSYFNTVEEAKDETGITKVVTLMSYPDDF
jgi:hypothetical protein